MRTVLVLTTLCLAAGEWARGQVAQQSSPPQAAQPAKVAIRAEDLNTRYEVYGPLGVPLGQVVTVVAEPFELNAKGDTVLIRVFTVDGRALGQPVDLPYEIWPWANIKSLVDNRRYELRAFQDGGFSGVPDQVMRETVYVQTGAYRFRTKLVVANSITPPTAVEQQSRRSAPVPVPIRP
jgi:hypothetical protein